MIWNIDWLGNFPYLIYVICICGVHHVLTIWVTWRVSYKRQEVLTLREHLGSPKFSGVLHEAHLSFFLFSFVFGLHPCLVCSLLWVSMHCQFLIAHLVFSSVYLLCCSSGQIQKLNSVLVNYTPLACRLRSLNWPISQRQMWRLYINHIIVFQYQVIMVSAAKSIDEFIDTDMFVNLHRSISSSNKIIQV